MRYLAIDYGNKYTGIAICDASETIASPVAVFKNPKTLAKKIADLVEEENIEAIVMGLPLNMDDSEGPQAKIVRKFTEHLKNLRPDPHPLSRRAFEHIRRRRKVGPSRIYYKKTKKTSRCHSCSRDSPIVSRSQTHIARSTTNLGRLNAFSPTTL